MNRRALLTTACSTTVIALAGCTEDNPDPEPPDDVDYFAGDIIRGEMIDFVVNDAERTNNGDIPFDAAGGAEFAVVDMSYKNVSRERNTTGFAGSIVDVDGNEYDSRTGTSTFIPGELLPGEVESGTVAFEIPMDAAGLTLELDEDFALPAELDDYRVGIEVESDDPERLEQNITEGTHELGDAVERDGLTITVTDYDVTDELDMYREASDGNEFVRIEVVLQNETGSRNMADTRAAHLKDGAGYMYTEDQDARDALSDPIGPRFRVNDGDETTGEVVYEVEEGLSPLYWCYKFGSRAIEGKELWRIR